MIWNKSWLDKEIDKEVLSKEANNISKKKPTSFNKFWSRIVDIHKRFRIMCVKQNGLKFQVL